MRNRSPHVDVAVSPDHHVGRQDDTGGQHGSLAELTGCTELC